MKRFNVIGDIHGRDVWKRLVKDDAVNIFLGDYFDPYDPALLEDELTNLEEIIRYKHEHPSTVLLLGNHDLHYLWEEQYSRFNYMEAAAYRRFLTAHIEEFLLAYAIGDEVLLTHAGVTSDWLRLAGIPGLSRPLEIADALTEVYLDLSRWPYLTADLTFEPGDFFGESPTASPVWVRPETLCLRNALSCGVQVVGHTQTDDPCEQEGVWFIDCLGYNPHSLLITQSPDGACTFRLEPPAPQR